MTYNSTVNVRSKCCSDTSGNQPEEGGAIPTRTHHFCANKRELETIPIGAKQWRK